MGGWVNLLPKAPPDQSASQVYENVLKAQAQRQDMAQRRDYNQARIQEQNALAAQHQRVMQVKDGLSKAYANNTKFNPDGTSTVNWAGVMKDSQDLGIGEVTPDIYEEAGKARKADLENLEGKAKYTAQKLGGVQRLTGDDWKDPNKVALSRDQSLTVIDELEREGILDPQTAAAQRAAAANFNPQWQGFLDSHSQQATALGTQFENAKKGVDAHIEQLTGGSKVTKAKADADKAVTEATKEGAALGGTLMEAGVVPANSNTGAADATNQFNTPISQEEQPAFQAWKQKYAPNDSGADYDLQGAFKAGVSPADNGHFPDTFKKPNHPTFSDESQYSGKNGNVGGHWNDNGTFTPGATNLQTHGVTGLQQYFDKNEPDTKLDIGEKDPKWTPEKQADWDAKRADPAFAGVKQYMKPVWSQKQEDAIGKLGPKQAAGANPSKVETDQLNLWGRKLYAAAKQGAVAYTAVYNGAPDNIKQLATNPKDFDPEKTPKVSADIGETAAQQENADKPPKAAALPGGMSESQYRMWFDRHETMQKEEAQQWKLTGEIGDVLNTPDGEDFRDPKSGKTVSMDKNQRNYWQKQYEGARTQATQLQQQAKEIRGRLHGGEFEGGGTPAAPAQPGATKPSATPQASAAPQQRVRLSIAPHKKADGTMSPARDLVFPNQKAADDFAKAAGLSPTK